MRIVKYIVYRYLTNADYFNIYKPPGTEDKGGGQSYIDFGTGHVSLENWELFFSDSSSVKRGSRAHGPSWTFQLASIGLDKSQETTIFQRRPQTAAISSQRITSRESNRIFAWHPKMDFPNHQIHIIGSHAPLKLAVYILRTENDEFWAGWFQNASPCQRSDISRHSVGHDTIDT